VINNSTHRIQRQDVALSVVIDADFATVERIAREAAGSVEGVLSEPAPQILVTALTGATMSVLVRFWLAETQARQRSVISQVTLAIRDGLRREGISLAPPPAPPAPPITPPTAQS